MDIATIIGIIAGFGLLSIAIVTGGSPGAFIHFPSMMITIGGAISATFITFSMKDLLSIGKVVKNAFFEEKRAIDAVVETMVQFSLIARREGVLALEKELNNVSNDFIIKGVQLAVDGTEEELTRRILETELEFISQRHSMGQRLFEKLGEYGPAFGMIGTLVGLIQMLKTLDDPSTLGPGMAVALITTLYGSIMANIVFLPLAGKLKNRSEEEELEKLIVLEGVISIQSGENPRLVREKLQSFIPKALRKVEE